ncbi:MAG: DsbA family protein [Gaiellaceae bacterium]
MAGAALLIAALLILGTIAAGRDGSTADVNTGGPPLSKTGAPPRISGAEARTRFAGVRQDGMALGSPNAPVTLVEFVDLQCPYCRAFALNGLPELLERYVRPGKLRIELRLMDSLGEDSGREQRFVLAAGLQGKAWEVADLLYLHQGTEGSGWVTDRNLAAVGRAVRGLDVRRALADRRRPAVAAQAAAIARSAEALRISGVPSYATRVRGGPVEVLDSHPQEASGLEPTLDDLLERAG